MALNHTLTTDGSNTANAIYIESGSESNTDSTTANESDNESGTDTESDRKCVVKEQARVSCRLKYYL